MEDIEARDNQIDRAFSDCRTAGLLNLNVLHEFLKVASTELQRKHLLPHRLKGDPHIKELLRRMPEKDKSNAK